VDRTLRERGLVVESAVQCDKCDLVGSFVKILNEEFLPRTTQTPRTCTMISFVCSCWFVTVRGKFFLIIGKEK